MHYVSILAFALVIAIYNEHCFGMNNMRSRRLQQRQIFADDRLHTTATAGLDELIVQQLSNENADIFPVESEISSNLHVIPNSHTHIKFYGFDDLFGNKLQFSKLFDENQLFRNELRKSIRNDLFVPSAVLSDAQNCALKDEKSTLMSKWRRPINYIHLDETLSKYKSNLDGNSFVKLFTDLCGNNENIFGSWIDIVGVRRKINHSWHQDSGLDQNTCMVCPQETFSLLPSSLVQHKIGRISNAQLL